MIKSLDVFLNSELAGRLSLTSSDEMVFTYSQDARRAISVSMPIKKISFGNLHCEAFFGGLLPESDEAKRALGRRFNISAHNTFSLLSAIGAECAGALSIIETGLSAPTEAVEEVRVLPESELAQHIRELPQRPLFIDVNGIRLSLAGFQDKAAVSRVEKGLGIPSSGPTTHILKPDLRQAPGAIFCEYLCMKTAQKLGFNVASVTLEKAEDQVYLLVERYDRRRAPITNHLERIHQEDFCQALIVSSTRKYQSDGGPKLEDCFNLLAQTATPAKERIALLNAVAFNYLSGNMDAHAKNFSLLHHKQGIRLAPMYDVLCTKAFPEFSKSMSMQIGDSYKPEEVCAHQWKLLCEDINYSYTSFKRQAKRIYTSLGAEVQQTYDEMQREGWSHPSCERAIKIIQNNCELMDERLNITS
ncbi:MAG TPA: type II toxin-antitoxin system HipA family toxin [Drouetiella sp.]